MRPFSTMTAAAILASATLASATLLVGGCNSSGGAHPVDATTDSRDFEAICEQMSNDMMSRPWIDNFKQSHGRNPVVCIFTIKNLTSDGTIQQELLTEQLRETLVNSGKADFRA